MEEKQPIYDFTIHAMSKIMPKLAYLNEIDDDHYVTIHDGELRLMHVDGFSAGYFKTVGELWVFVPDYMETDEL